VYVIQISPDGDRARVWLDPSNRAPVYVAFSECPQVSRLTFEYTDSRAYVYERSE